MKCVERVGRTSKFPGKFPATDFGRTSKFPKEFPETPVKGKGGCIRCILYTAVWLYSLYTVYSGLLYAVYSIVKQCVAAVYRVYSGIQRTSYTAPPTAGSDAVGHDERPSPLHSHVWIGTVTIAAQRLSVVSFAIAMSIDSE